MKRKISRFLLKLARWFDPSCVLRETPEARPMGICIHIAKKDIRAFRKAHPEVKSHRKGMELLIEEAKWRAAGAIARGMVKNKVIDFNVSKTLSVADVVGMAYVYGGDKEETEGARQ